MYLNAADKDSINRLIQKRKNNIRKPIDDRSIGFLDKTEPKEKNNMTLDDLFKDRNDEPKEVMEDQIVPQTKKRITLDDMFKDKAEEDKSSSASSSSMKNVHNLTPQQKKRIMNEWWG